MFQIDQDTKQIIIITNKDACKLKIELEEMFFSVDANRRGRSYSLEWITRHFPLVAKLYRLL